MTDWKGGVYNEAGLDIPKLIDWTREHKTVDGFPGAEPLTNEQIFTLDVDFLIPAALENQITVDNARDIKARVDRRRRQRPDDAGRAQDPPREGRLRRARHPGQRAAA